MNENTLGLGKVNLLAVKVVYNPSTRVFTISPHYGELSKTELSEKYSAGLVDFATMAQISTGRILDFFGINVMNPEIVPREDPASTKAEYVFTIEERQVPCV